MSPGNDLWREKLNTYLQGQANPPHKYGHQPRLYTLTEAIASQSPELVYDDDVVFAAAFLHDLGVFVGHRPEDPKALKQWDHVAYACSCAPSLLSSFGFPPGKVPHVLAVIQEHQPQDVPHSPEATLLRDADILEQLGSIAVLRTASKVGSDTRFHSFSAVRQSLQNALDRLPGALGIEAARELAKPRIVALKAFLMALDEEAGEHLD